MSRLKLSIVLVQHYKNDLSSPVSDGIKSAHVSNDVILGEIVLGIDARVC